MTKQYLSRTDVAEKLGISPGTLAHTKLPEPDVVIGINVKNPIRGWLPETIDEWNKNRPGKGNWRTKNKTPPG